MEEKLLKIVSIIVNIIKILSITLANVVLFIMFINTKEITTKIILIPFIICFVSALFSIIGSVINKDIIVKITSKIYIIGFLIFWIGFLIVFTKLAIEQNNDKSLIIYTIPFWLFAILLIYKNFIKK